MMLLNNLSPNECNLNFHYSFKYKLHCYGALVFCDLCLFQFGCGFVCNEMVLLPIWLQILSLDMIPMPL